MNEHLSRNIKEASINERSSMSPSRRDRQTAVHEKGGRQNPSPIESEQHGATTTRTPFDTAHPSTSRRVSASSKASFGAKLRRGPPSTHPALEKNVDDRLSFGQSSSDQRKISPSRIESRARRGRDPPARKKGQRQLRPAKNSRIHQPSARRATQGGEGHSWPSLVTTAAPSPPPRTRSSAGYLPRRSDGGWPVCEKPENEPRCRRSIRKEERSIEVGRVEPTRPGPLAS
ncbi:hypothetical protein HPB47_012439 [Ixodes persulcatus]|uniref:Uncharacterized protein n=1 Tax=Ixodes persulcatus TaxID=34615 RepID=A0AC60NTN3_IXOPE|nr:hypothetical protein HPB47_012439 [Ixodes persulcatus]